jgi:hypothetical protein
VSRYNETTSTNVMLKKCEGLIDTTDVNEWENGFLQSILDLTERGTRPDRLTPRQLETLMGIYGKNFG